MDDDLDDRGPTGRMPDHTPVDARDLEMTPEAEEAAALAIPRTITAELEGPERPPSDDPPPPPSGGGDPPAPPGGDGRGPPRAPDQQALDRARAELPLHVRDLQKIAERLCATTTDADELVQNTAERAFKTGLPMDVKKPLHWLTRMMHRLFLDDLRAVKRRRVESLQEWHTEALHDNGLPMHEPARIWERVSGEDVRDALREITPAFREVFELHEFEGWSYEQIAIRMEISTVTVGTRLSRVRKRLREILTRKGGKDDD